MLITPKMNFETQQGKGLVVNKDTLINPVNIGYTDIETPVRLGGAAIIAVKKIGAFAILPPSGLLRCIEEIGRFTIIAPDVQIGNPQHCAEAISPHPMFGKFDSEWNQSFHTLYDNKEWIDSMKKKQVECLGKRILGYSTIGNDVWIGQGAIIMRGCNIGDGAIVGARAVVTKDVPPYSIVAGNPARIVRMRYSAQEIASLLDLQWWKYGPDILKGLDLMNVRDVIEGVSEKIQNGMPEYCSESFRIYEDRYEKI